MSKQLSAEEVIKRIMEHTGKSYDEVKEMVTKTRESLNNFVNEQGAAYLLANNLDVPLTDNSVKSSSMVKIEDIVEGMGPISLYARISKVYNTKHFMRKDNTPGQLRRLELVDSSGKIYATLWNEKTKLVEDLDLRPGRIIRIANAEPRMGLNDTVELNIGTRATIDTNIIGVDEKDFPVVEEDKVISIGEIKEEMENITIYGKIIERRAISEFERKDGTTGKVTSLTIMDKTGKIRVTFWDDDTSRALAFDEGQTVKLTGLRAFINNNGFPELTFKSYSNITPFASEELEQLTYEKSSFESPVMKIGDINEESKNVTIVGKVISKNNEVTFMSEKGEGKLQSITVGDSSGIINVNFWNEDLKKLEDIAIDDIVKITNAYTRYSDYSQRIELNAGKFTELIKNPTDIDEEISIPYVTFEDIQDRMNGVFIRLKLISDPMERTTVRKVDNTEAHVINVDVIDENGETGRLAAWDDDRELIKNLKVEDTIEVQMGRAKRDDYGVSITLGRNSKVKTIADFDESKTLLQTADKLRQSNIYETLELDKIQPGMNVYVEAKVVKIFSKIGFYDSCPLCPRKVSQDDSGVLLCKEHGTVENSRKRMIVTVTLDDASSITLKAKFFSDQAEKLFGLSSQEAFDINERIGEEGAVVEQVKDKILLKPIWIKGKSVEDNDEVVIQVNSFGWLDPHKKTDEILSRYQGF